MESVKANPYEVAGRLKKVFAIMPLLIKLGISSKDLEGATGNEKFWGLIHDELKIGGTSPATRAMCLEKLCQHEKENGVS